MKCSILWMNEVSSETIYLLTCVEGTMDCWCPFQIDVIEFLTKEILQLRNSVFIKLPKIKG